VPQQATWRSLSEGGGRVKNADAILRRNAPGCFVSARELGFQRLGVWTPFRPVDPPFRSVDAPFRSVDAPFRLVYL
jgi:hypothetical protein